MTSPSRGLRRASNRRSAARTSTVRAAAASLVMAGGLLGTTALAPHALAHDAVVKSTPSNGEVIKEMPEELTLEFSGEPKDGFNTVAVSQNGKVLFKEEPKVEGNMLTVDVPDDVKAEPGDYSLGYQITSSDGHATRGSLEFSIEGSGESASESTDAPAATEEASDSNSGESSSGVPSWLLPLAGIVVIAGALVLAIARFRNLKND